MVIDHLLGWRSIVSTYEANFAFDLTDAMRRIAAPTLVLEMQTEDEARFGAQAPALCAMMKRARAAVLPECRSAPLSGTRPTSRARARSRPVLFHVKPDRAADRSRPTT